MIDVSYLLSSALQWSCWRLLCGALWRKLMAMAGARFPHAIDGARASSTKKLSTALFIPSLNTFLCLLFFRRFGVSSLTVQWQAWTRHGLLGLGGLLWCVGSCELACLCRTRGIQPRRFDVAGLQDGSEVSQISLMYPPFVLLGFSYLTECSVTCLANDLAHFAKEVLVPSFVEVLSEPRSHRPTMLSFDRS